MQERLKKFYHFNRKYIIKPTEREVVINNLLDEGEITGRFVFFSIISSAIATLGLLLNSPAIIIGAMLISPLMGAIVLQGFSLSLIDVPFFKKSMFCLSTGVVLGIFTSFAIVKLSPVTNITTEIMARTSPNFFDLLVAVFSGTAAAYVYIKQKGAAIVGAAIATALMPPLSVTGFGLATQNFWIAKGAFFLFMTNFVAIGLSVFFVSLFFGFTTRRERQYIPFQILFSLLCLFILSIPLGISLKNIAYQGYITTASRNVIKDYFKDTSGLINDLKIDFHKKNIEIEAVVITKRYVPKAKTDLIKKLNAEVDKNIKLHLTQIALINDIPTPKYVANLQETNKFTTAQQTWVQNTDQKRSIQDTIKNQIIFPTHLINVDQNSGTLDVLAKYDPNFSLHNFRYAEKIISKQFPKWIVRVLPALQPIPSIYFGLNSDEISAQNLITLDDNIWALGRWQIQDIDVVGYASSIGDAKINKTLAISRARAVANILKEKGFNVSLKTRVRIPAEIDDERFKGYDGYQRVDIRLPTKAPSRAY